ncbi:MAG TPA: hypothetical protein VJO35_04390 [Terriglobales bacterium]|nr:hypothetical protein [Terriglobales bacterium]
MDNTPQRELKEPEQPAIEERRKHEEEGLDKTIEDSFPASDPPSTIPNPDEDEEDAA